MRKKIRANEKGAVLLTVLCFTTVIMIVAATALKIATFANRQSTQNLCKTQAQIIAENYLVGYLSTFTDVNADGSINYDTLKTLAGGNTEQTATQVVCSLREEGTNTIVNTDERTAGGTCTIYIYNSNGGVVVKSAATYNGETEIASAFFDGKIVRPYDSNNVIETNGGYNVTDIAAPVWGDVMIENVDTTIVTKFHNSNGEFNGNFYSNSNLYFGQGTTTQKFRDTARGYAPTITAVGNIFMTNLDMKTTVGKTDKNGKKAADAGYDRNLLLNKDGYINSDSSIILGQGCDIGGYNGTKKDSIDMYCRNLYIGSIQTPAGASATVANQVADVSAAVNSAGMALYQNGVGQFITGNVYVKKGSGSSQLGNVYVNQNGSGAIVNGDMFVDGDIYIIAGKLTIKGALYCGGTIYAPDGSVITNPTSSSYIDCIMQLSTNASNTRSIKPDMDYAPGLYEFGVKDDPTISNPSTYRDSTPNDMYKEGTISNLTNPDLAKAAKYIQDKFQFALAHGTDTPYTDGSGNTAYPSDIVTVNYSQRSAKYNTGVNIVKSCKLSLTEVDVSCVAGNTPAKFTVHVTNEDIVILLPLTGTSTQMGAKIRVDNSAKTGDYFVYFMFYDPNNSAEATTNYYTKTVAQNSSKTIIFAPGPNAKGGAQISDTMFCEMNSNTITNYGSTNIFYMLPDGLNMNLGSNGIHSVLQGVVYGPKSKINFTEPANSGDFSGIYGQIKVESYYVAQNHNIQNIFNCPPANDSILGFIAAKQPSSGNLKFKYYIKHT